MPWLTNNTLQKSIGKTGRNGVPSSHPQRNLAALRDGWCRLVRGKTWHHGTPNNRAWPATCCFLHHAKKNVRKCLTTIVHVLCSWGRVELSLAGTQNSAPVCTMPFSFLSPLESEQNPAQRIYSKRRPWNELQSTKKIGIAHSFQILGPRDWNHLPLNPKGQIWLLNFQSKTSTFGKFCPKFSPSLAWQSSSRLTLGRLRSLVPGVAFSGSFHRKILDFFSRKWRERKESYLYTDLFAFLCIYLFVDVACIHSFLSLPIPRGRSDATLPWIQDTNFAW